MRTPFAEVRTSQCPACYTFSTAWLTSATKAVEQARQVIVLTKLAFLSVPASLISLAFGINVAELQDNPTIGSLCFCSTNHTHVACRGSYSSNKSSVGKLENTVPATEGRRAARHSALQGDT